MIFPALQIILGFAQKYVVNFVEYNDTSMLKNVYVLSGIMLFILFVIKPVASYLRDNLIARFNNELREKFYNHIERLPLTYFDKTHSGELISRFTNDLNNIANIYSNSIRNLLLAIFYGVGSVISMVFLCWQLSIFILFLGLFETWLITKFSQKVRDISNQIQKKTGLSNQRMMNIIQGFKTIKLLSLSHLMLEKYKKENEKILEDSIERNNKMLVMDVINNIFTSLNLLGTLGVGVILLHYGYIDLGSVMAFLILQDGVTYMFNGISTFSPGLQGTLASSQRVLTVFDELAEPEKLSASTGTQIQPIAEQGIYIRDLSFDYAENSKDDGVLKDVTCKIEPGKVTAFIGPSGCGKTTLLKILLGLYQPQHGEIYLNGTSYRDYTISQIRDSFSYVPQFPFLSHDTVEENIRFGYLQSSFDQIVSTAKMAYAHEFIMKMPDGYKTIITEQGANVSGGEKQRIALARAICRNANIMILDEATTGLDSESETYIKAAIDNLVKGGYTVIVVAHRPSTIRNADHIIVMDQGMIVQQGSYEELMSIENIRI
jgi:ABC-type multidrug transport system fused ATPase/permease subunit